MAPQTPPGSDGDSADRSRDGSGSAKAAQDLDARLEAARAALGRAVAREESAAGREHSGVAGDRPPSQGDDNARARRRLPDGGLGTLGVAAVAVLTALVILTVAFVALSGSHSSRKAKNSGSATAESKQPTAVSVADDQSPVSATRATASPSASRTKDRPTALPKASPHTAVATVSPTSAAPSGALVVQASGKCLTNSGAGAQATFAACDGSASQRWTFATDRTLRSAGLCLNVSGGATADRTPITLAACDTSGQQLFRLTTAHTLVAEKSAKCVDEFGGASGTLAVLWECDGRDNQDWTLS